MCVERGLRAAQAAEYCRLKVGKFEALVKAGTLPAPLPFGRPRVWDRKAIDHALDKLSGLPSTAAAPDDGEALAVKALKDGEAAVLKALHDRHDALRNGKTKPR